MARSCFGPMMCLALAHDLDWVDLTLDLCLPKIIMHMGLLINFKQIKVLL